MAFPARLLPEKAIRSEYAHRLQDIAKEVAVSMKKAYRCDGIFIRQHNEPAGGQTVWHYHNA